MPTTYVWNSSTAAMNSVSAYTPNGVPTNGDTIIFPTDATTAPATSMTVFNAVAFARVTVAPGCRIDIGGAGNPFVTSAVLLEHFGLGTLYYQSEYASDWAFYQNSPNVDSATVVSSGTNAWPNVNIGRGHFRFGVAGAGITRARITRTGFPTRDAKFTVTAAVDYVAYLVQESGESNISVAVPYLTVSGGRYTQIAATIADARITGGYVTMGASGGIIGTNCELTGGTLDLTTYPLTRSMGKIVKYAGAKYLYPEGMTTHTLVDLPRKFGVT